MEATGLGWSLGLLSPRSEDVTVNLLWGLRAEWSGQLQDKLNMGCLCGSVD